MLREIDNIIILANYTFELFPTTGILVILYKSFREQLKSMEDVAERESLLLDQQIIERKSKTKVSVIMGASMVDTAYEELTEVESMEGTY